MLVKIECLFGQGLYKYINYEVVSLFRRPCPLPKTNERFIHNMVIGAMQANRRTTHKGTSSKEETHKQGKSSHSKSFNDKECLKSTNSKSNTRRKRHAREDLPSSKCDELKISSRKKYKK